MVWFLLNELTSITLRWWHDWNSDDLDELAGSLVAGHLIECSAYVTGGYCSAFKDLIKSGKHVNLGFPIAAVNHRGECVLSKEKNTGTFWVTRTVVVLDKTDLPVFRSGGMVTVDSVSSQLLYEIQGPLYYGSDVVAQLEGIQMEQIGEDEVQVTGIKGLAPPETTKVG